MHKRAPTMQQISRKAAEIRKRWPEAERRRRADIARRCVALLSLMPEARLLAQS
jgi:hypothetical protein